MSNITIYHNPRCSKSRQTLALIEGAGIKPEIILYLENPPSAKKLKHLLTLLNFSPRELVRKGEAIYKTLGLGNKATSDAQLIDAMLENPILIERPIVESATHACIGRPPEAVLEII
ncbi:MAG: arsenate reductase (glutaredoxin) [Pseudomonadales bacterium]|nr:arsenate reductase (glutaredoxin) [Pseudomonadales bacterium]